MTAVPPLLRPVRDMVAHRLGRARGAQWGAHLQWPGEPPLREALAADSLDLVDAAEGVLRLFGIDELGWEDTLLMRPSLAGWAAVAAAALAEHGSLRFATSGSQGEPVEHRHRLATLQAEAATLAALIGPRSRVVCAVPTQHIYGFLFGVLLPQQLDCPVIDTCGLPPSAVLRTLQPGDLLVAHPLLWARIAEVPAAWPGDVVGSSSTAPLPRELAERLRTGRLTRLIEVYGSSETAGIGWRDDPAAAFALFPRWHAADAQSLLADDGRRIALPDRCAVEGRCIRPLARLDRAVQVAGHNVHPDRVARLLEQAPGVQSARVRLDPSSGRLKAQVVPLPGATLDEDDLRAWSAAHLASPERPARYSVVAEHGVGVLGKGSDW